MNGPVRRTLRALAILLGVVALAVLAWWFVRPSQENRLSPLDNPPPAGRSAGRSASAQADADERDPFAGRRRLDGPRAPEDVQVSSLGDESSLGEGHRLRVTAYEATLRYSADDGVDLVVDLAQVAACAGSTEWVGGALAPAYHLAYPRSAGGFDLRPASSGLSPRKPPLSRALTGDALGASDCAEGWLAFALGTTGDFDDRLPTAIVFDNTSFDFVPTSGKGRLAWGLGE